MGQVTIYLEDEEEVEMTDKWPDSIKAFAGAWKDLEFADEAQMTDIKKQNEASAGSLKRLKSKSNISDEESILDAMDE